MIDLYLFDDYRAFLRAWLAEDPSRTYRKVAKSLKCSAALLSAIVATGEGKQRPMGLALVKNFCRAAAFDTAAAEYFHLLVAKAHGSRAEREQAVARLTAIRRFRAAQSLDNDQARFLAAWYHPALFELARCAGFRPDPAWIAAILNPPIPVEQARAALDLLRSLRLLRTDAEGREVPVDDLRLELDEEEARAALARWHAWLCARGVIALDVFPRDERFFNAITVAVPSALLPEMSLRIQEFLREMLSLAGQAEAPRDRVVQLNIQLFPVSDRTTDALPDPGDPPGPGKPKGKP